MAQAEGVVQVVVKAQIIRQQRVEVVDLLLASIEDALLAGDNVERHGFDSFRCRPA